MATDTGDRIGHDRATDQTLAEWCEEYRATAPMHSSGQRWTVPPSECAQSALFWLSDYRVTSVHGGAVWLMPR